MNIKSIVNYMCAAILALLSAAATASPLYKFELSGSYTATWEMTMTVAPNDSFASQQFTIWNVVGAFENASTSKVDLTFFNSAEGGGLNIYDFAANVNLLSTDGPQLYTGTEGSPVFTTGTFALTQFQGIGQYALVVSEVASVPEPASLSLMLCGLLGAAGASCRKRRDPMA
ncbi:hypothetical protein ASC95_08410 [Pelomonas sp. Root1217]|uniref:PEP-CTERM sorting domain-containing protein n=1 Tax=Pelomonas sp. Root1217 TaxID=1736430 RepID=UPI00070FF0B4|nr:PEP-CTERM sorting domain-containing protein [Pelomonas sp. Root1217]KQV52817.1 hypothetical protein ASC95_08410 [Pelomonas sp. Root1217]